MEAKNKKITVADLPIQKGKIDIEFIEVEGKKVNLTPINYGNIENYITHKNCDNCGNEFEKQYTYEKLCRECQLKISNEKYFKLDFVEWDGQNAVCLYNEDQYFFNEEEILEFCDENEINLEDLQLVLCYRTSFSPIDLQNITEELTYEDWEPSDDFMEKFNEFNKWLTAQSTETWMPSNKRIDIIEYFKK